LPWANAGGTESAMMESERQAGTMPRRKDFKTDGIVHTPSDAKMLKRPVSVISPGKRLLVK
jgi:hypothetical protein